MADEDNKKPKDKFAGLGGEPGEDEQPTPKDETPEESTPKEGSVWDTNSLEKITLDGKNVWVDEERAVVAYETKTKSGKEGIMYAMPAGFYFEPKGGTPERVADAAKEAVGKSVATYQTKANAFYKAQEEANKAPVPPAVPPAETPKEDTEFEEFEEDLEGKVDETPKGPPARAPARAPSAAGIVVDKYRLKFNKGLFSASVTVYEGNKIVGSYTAFGGTVKGPAVDKLPQNVVDAIKETYLNGLKGK